MRSNLGIHKSFLLIGTCLSLLCLGCGSREPIRVSLQYPVADDEQKGADLSVRHMTVARFSDNRSGPFIWKQNMVMQEGDDGGTWVANALVLELRHAGATVDTVPEGERLAKGCFVTGRVNELFATNTGWHLGGLIAAFIGTGFSPHICFTLELAEDGVPVFQKQYDIQENVPSNGFKVWLIGPTPATDVPAAYSVVLKKLLRDQVLPDIHASLGDLTNTSSGTTR